MLSTIFSIWKEEIIVRAVRCFSSCPKLAFFDVIRESIHLVQTVKNGLLLAGTCSFWHSLLRKFLEHWQAKCRKLKNHDWYIRLLNMRYSVKGTCSFSCFLQCKVFNYWAAERRNRKRPDWPFKFSNTRSYSRYFSQFDFFRTNCWLTARVVCRKVSIMSSAIVSNVSEDLWCVLHLFDLTDKSQCVSGIESKISCPIFSRIELMITMQQQAALNRRLLSSGTFWETWWPLLLLMAGSINMLKMLL